MPLDPQAKLFLDNLAAQKRPAWDTMSPAEGRKLFSSFTKFFGEKEPVQKVKDEVVAENVPARVYTPQGMGPFPVVMYFHGGGWVLGDLDTHDSLCRRLAIYSGCVVVAVHYRRAPEHKFPVALEDCFSATKYVAENPQLFQADSSRIAVAGDSAGGNLAAGVCLMARDHGGPSLALQLLIYPVIEHSFTTNSYEELADGFGLTRSTMKWFWQQYLRSDVDGQQPYASPSLDLDLRGLPAAHVITAQYDVLRDEGEAFAARFADAGVKTSVQRYDGMIHGFTHFADIFDQGKESLRDVAKVIKETFGISRQ